MLKSRQEMIGMVLKDSALVRTMEQAAEEEKKDYHTIYRRAEKVSG